MGVVHVYTITRNQDVLMPYFLKHYETFADKIFIFDDRGTNDLEKLTRPHPKVHVMNYPHEAWSETGANDVFEKSYKRFSRGRADWVMCVDDDEFVYHPDIQIALQNATNKGGDVIRTTCYTMVASKTPTTEHQIYDELKKGVRTDAQDKAIIFNPKVDIKFDKGRHTLLNRDDLHIVKANILLLHYRYLGWDYAEKRTREILALLNEPERVVNYRLTKSRAFYDKALKEAEVVV